MSAFEISVTPPRFKQKKNMESREPTLVVMAPFSSKSIVQFEDVPLGKTAKRTLRIINPSDEDIEVKVTKYINEEHNITMDWTESPVPAQSEVEMLLVWSPQIAIACKETLQFTDNRNFRKDVMVILKSKSNQPAKNNSKFPTLSSGVQKTTTHIKTLRLKSPTGSKKVSRNPIQHRKSSYSNEKVTRQTPTKARTYSTFSAPLTGAGVGAGVGFAAPTQIINKNKPVAREVPPGLENTKTSPLTERNIYNKEKTITITATGAATTNSSSNLYKFSQENSPFSVEALKENVSPLTPGSVFSLIDNLNFTPATETFSKNYHLMEESSLWPTPMSASTNVNCIDGGSGSGGGGTAIDYKFSNDQMNRNSVAEVRPRRLLPNDLEDDLEDLITDKKDEGNEQQIQQIIPNKTFEIKSTDTFNISTNESLEVSNCDMNRLSVGPVLNKTTTISSVHPMRALEMIQEEEGMSTLNLDTSPLPTKEENLQKTYHVTKSNEKSDLKRDIKLVGSPLRKYSESMKDLSLHSPKNKLGIQGSMPNLNEMNAIRSIEQNRYFYQKNLNKLSDGRAVGEERSSLELEGSNKLQKNLLVKNSLDDSLNASTDSQVSLASQTDLLFNQNEILAQSSRFNLNEVGLKSRKNSPVSSAKMPSKGQANKTKASPKANKSFSNSTGTQNQTTNLKKRRSIDLSQSDVTSNESLLSNSSTKSQNGHFQVSPPKKSKVVDPFDVLFQKPFAPTNSSDTRSKNWSMTQPKKFRNCTTLTLIKRTGTPKKEKLEKPVKLYDSDLYLQACINPDPFAATTTCDPFLASTMYLDERAVERHQMDFKKWLNALVTIPADLDADCNAKIDVGKLFNEVRNKELTLAPTKEEQSMNYLTQYRLESLRRVSIELFMSEELRIPCSKVAVYVNKNTIRIRSDRNLHLDVVMQRYILELLLCFNPLWLRLGLEVVYGERIHLQSNNDIVGLSSFILNRLFRDKYLEQKHSRAYALSERYAEVIKKFTLIKFLSLLLFMDKAKSSKIIKHNPCLFNKKSPYKETREILCKFSSELLANVGDITRELRRLGYVLQHKQTYLDEFDYAFSNIAVDLRDGIRLTRVMEIILLRDDLTKQLRVPAISRLQRIFNVNLGLRALGEADFHLKGEITAADIVDGHREKTLSLLWQIIYKFRSPKFHAAARLIQNWWRRSWLKVLIKRRIRRKEELRREKAATTIQAFYRAYVTKKFVKKHREECNKGATTLQKYVRRYLARKKFFFCINAIQKIQKWFKATLLARQKRQEFLRLKKSVILVQQIYRRRLLAAQFLAFANELRAQIRQRRLAAAACIQMFWRGYCLKKIARAEFLQIRKASVVLQQRFRATLAMRKERANYLLIRKAVVKIQTFYRAYKLKKTARSLYLKERQALILLQRRRRALLEMRQERSLYLAKRSAIIKLQQRFRALEEMKKQKQSYMELKANCIRIQRLFRGRMMMKEQLACYQNIRSKVILIQRKLRATLLAKKVRFEFFSLQYYTTLVQQKFRAKKEMRRVRAEFIELKHTTIYIQRRFRSLLVTRKARADFLRLRNAALVIQTHFKAYKKMRYFRARYRGIREATLCLQSHVRGYLKTKRQREEFLQKRKAAIVLQRAFRARKFMQKIRLQYNQLLAATVVMQRRYRAQKEMILQRAAYLKDRSLIIQMQRLYRAKLLGRVVKKQYLKDRQAIVRLQIRFKATLLMRLERQKYQETKLKLVKLQRRFKGHLAMLKERSAYLEQRKAAIRIQSWYRSVLNVRKHQRDYQDKRAYIIFLQRKFRATLAARKQQQEYLRTLKVIRFQQRVWRATLMMRKERSNYQKLRGAALVLQRRFRAKILMVNLRNQYLLIRSMIVFLQLKYRGYLLMKKQRCEFLELRRVTVFCQRQYRSKLLMIEDRRRFCSLKSGLIKFQARARGFLARKRFQALMTPEMKEMRRRTQAALILQRCWRGHLVRKRFHNLHLKLLRKNIKDLREASTAVNSVRNKVQDAVRLLKGRFNASEALHVLSRLDRLSRTVPHLLMNHSNFISTFCYGIMAQTIRSEIDKQLIEHCSRIILNLARYNSTTANTFQESGLVTIAQMLLRWCDKDSEIFNTLCTLIWIFAQCPEKRKIIHDFMTTPEAIYMVRETKKLVARKEKMKQNVRSNVILSKNSKKNVSSRSLPSLEPDYGVVQNQTYTFISSVYAFDTILCKLGINVF